MRLLEGGISNKQPLQPAPERGVQRGAEWVQNDGIVHETKVYSTCTN